MSRFELSTAALAQIKDISAYIAEDNPVRAISFIDELLAACRLRADMPRSGQLRPELDGNPRSFPFGPYVVLYDVLNDDGGILVLAIIHARQDILREFHRP
jgi:toxin ParE1/3/4